MQLSKEQQQVVADNMGLVGKVIRDKVHNVDQGIIIRWKTCFRSDV